MENTSPNAVHTNLCLDRLAGKDRKQYNLIVLLAKGIAIDP